MTTRLRPLAAASALAALALASPPGTLAQTSAQPGAVLYTGARLITGDAGPAVEDGALLVENGRITAVGRARDVKAPKGATVVTLAGKTVIPTLVDTHTHASPTREGIVDDLQRRAYMGVGAMMSLGTDKGDLPFQMRAASVPDGARFRTAGRGITAPEPGRFQVFSHSSNDWVYSSS